MNKASKRLLGCIMPAFPKAGKTILWLLKIILPASLLVSFLQYWGIIDLIAVWLAPAFSIIGLPGESSVVFISSLFLPLYAPIAIISSLSLGIREITILSLMCLISHNMIVETAIQKKTGSSATSIFVLRIITSFVSAYILNMLLPKNLGTHHAIQGAIIYNDALSVLANWIKSSGMLSLKISLIITGLLILQNILKEFNIINFLSRIFSPFMRIMGLPNECSFLWFVAQTLGLTYGAAVMIEEVQNSEISKKNADLLNYHIALNHSLLEDSLLFAAIGVPVGWIIAPRFVFAIIAVWSIHVIAKFRTHPQPLEIS